MFWRSKRIHQATTLSYHVDRYAKHFGKDPVDLGPEDVRNFQLWMIREKKSSWRQFNQAVCGLRLFRL